MSNSSDRIVSTTTSCVIQDENFNSCAACDLCAFLPRTNSVHVFGFVTGLIKLLLRLDENPLNIQYEISAVPSESYAYLRHVTSLYDAGICFLVLSVLTRFHQ